MSKYKDFDEFFAEFAKEPVKFRVGGRDFEAPPELPASVALQTLATMEKYGSQEDVPESELLQMALALLTKEQLAILTDEVKVSINQLGAIISWLLQQYGLASAEGTETDDEKGNPLQLASP